MDKVDLEQHTKIFALRVIRFVSTWSKSKAADMLSYQLMRSATSIGANYREVNRAPDVQIRIPKSPIRNLLIHLYHLKVKSLKINELDNKIHRLIYFI